MPFTSHSEEGLPMYGTHCRSERACSLSCWSGWKCFQGCVALSCSVQYFWEKETSLCKTGNTGNTHFLMQLLPPLSRRIYCTNPEFTFMWVVLLAGRWDFGLCRQQQLICVILLLVRRLSSLINTAVSVQGLQRQTQRNRGKEINTNLGEENKVSFT